MGPRVVNIEVLDEDYDTHLEKSIGVELDEYGYDQLNNYLIRYIIPLIKNKVHDLERIPRDDSADEDLTNED